MCVFLFALLAVRYPPLLDRGFYLCRFIITSHACLGQPAKVNMFFSMVTGGVIGPNRMTALNLRTDPSCSFCGYAARHVCSSVVRMSRNVSHCLVSTHRFFPKRGLLGILMKPTHPCLGPLEFQACPIHRYLFLARRRLQIGKRRMTLVSATIVKGRLKLQARSTWMVLHLTQRLLNCDVRSGVLLSENTQNRRH